MFPGMLEFLTVTRLEFRPFCRIVSKPLAKVSAWRNILEPEIDSRLVLGQASRPKPVHQDSRPVVSVRLIIDPFDSNRHGRQWASSNINEYRATQATPVRQTIDPIISELLGDLANTKASIDTIVQ